MPIGQIEKAARSPYGNQEILELRP